MIKPRTLLLKLARYLGVDEFVKRVIRASLENRDSYRGAVYLGDHLAITKTIYGHKVFVNTKDMSLTPHILLDGFWESWITKVFQERIRPGYTVVDVGGNLGYYSLLAAEAIGKHGKLYSFEANPDVAEILWKNMNINGFLDRVKVEPLAVYSEPKKLEFKIQKNHQGGSSFFLNTESAESFHDEIEILEVDCIKLDDYFPSGTKVDLIKIDTEGADPHVILGAQRVIAENPGITIITEFDSRFFNQSFESAEKAYDLYRTLGFTVYRIGHDSSLIVSSYRDLLNAGPCDILLEKVS